MVHAGLHLMDLIMEVAVHVQVVVMLVNQIVDQVVVKGKTEPVTVFEVFNGDLPEIREAKLSTTKLYEEAVSIYYLTHFEDSLSMFQECLDKFPEDKVAQIYIDRCKHYLKVGWDEDWDGVEILESK